MKVYTHLVIDMNTDEVLHEESYNYEGPVALCGGGSGGGGGSSVPEVQTSIIREAPGIEERKIGLMDISRALAEQPITIPGQQIAPFTALEQQGLGLAGQTGAGQQTIQGGIAGLQGAQSALAQGAGSAQFQSYLNPYQQYVIDEINRQAQIGQNQLAGQAVQAGAFGGGRQGIQAAEAERARLGKVGEAQAMGFGQALQGFQTGTAQQAQIGANLLTAGQVEQQQQQQDINQLMAAGGLQRQLAQQALDAERARQLHQAYEPYQRAEFLKAQYQGGPTSQSGVTTATTPGTNPLAQAAGAGLGAYAAYQTAQAGRPVTNINVPK